MTEALATRPDIVDIALTRGSRLLSSYVRSQLLFIARAAMPEWIPDNKDVEAKVGGFTNRCLSARQPIPSSIAPGFMLSDTDQNVPIKEQCLPTKLLRKRRLCNLEIVWYTNV